MLLILFINRYQKMKKFLKILLATIVVVVVVGATAMFCITHDTDLKNCIGLNSDTITNVKDTVYFEKQVNTITDCIIEHEAFVKNAKVDSIYKNMDSVILTAILMNIGVSDKYEIVQEYETNIEKYKAIATGAAIQRQSIQNDTLSLKK